jgi:K+-sensing histidine kinase KdpD
MLRDHRTIVLRSAAIVVPVVVAALLVPFRASFAATASALLLSAVVVAVAASGDRVSGYFATLSATLSFDVLLTQPYGRLAIDHRPDLETAICLFVVGIAVTEISVRGRHHRDAASEESEYVSVLHSVSELVASGASRQEVTAVVRAHLIELLHLRDCRFEANAAERPRFQIESTGDVFLGGSLWGVDRLGLPGPKIELPVYSAGTTAGRFVLTPTPGLPISRERRIVAVALADQVGASVRPRLRSA